MTQHEMVTEKVLGDVRKERDRQDRKWTVGRRHAPGLWFLILMEECGEAAKAALESYFGDGNWRDYRKEMVHAAAVLVAMGESHDRVIADRGYYPLPEDP